MGDAELTGIIGGDATGFLKAVGKSLDGLSKLSKSASSVGKNLTKSFNAVTGAAGTLAKQAAIVGGALAATGALAFKSFARFEKKFAEVTSLFDASDAQVKQLRDGIQKLSREFGVDVITSTEAAYQAISAGVKPAKVLEFLTQSFKTATAGATDVFKATDLLTTSLNSFNVGAEEAEKFSDILFATIREGKTTAGELAGSMGRVAAISSQAGIRFDEVGASLAALTKAGVSTDEAATSLRAVLVGILKPSDQAAAALGAIGINAQSLKKVGLVAVMKRIGEATGGASDKIAKLFPNVRALAGTAILAGKGFKEFQRISDSVAQSAGATEVAFAKLADTSAFRFARLAESGKAAFRSLGEALQPFFESLVDPLTIVFDDIRGSFGQLAMFFQLRSEAIRQAFGGILLAGQILFKGIAEGIGINLGAAGQTFDSFLKLVNSNFEEIFKRSKEIGIAIGEFVKKVIDVFVDLKPVFSALASVFGTVLGLVASLAQEFPKVTAVVVAFGVALAALQFTGLLPVITSFAALGVSLGKLGITTIPSVLRGTASLFTSFVKLGKNLFTLGVKTLPRLIKTLGPKVGIAFVAVGAGLALGKFIEKSEAGKAIIDALSDALVKLGEKLGLVESKSVAGARILEDSLRNLQRRQADLADDSELFQRNLEKAATLRTAIAQGKTGGITTGTGEELSKLGFEGFQTGGPVRKSGLATLDQGEFVLNPRSVAALGPVLTRALNDLGPGIQNNFNVNVAAGAAQLDERTLARAILPELMRLQSRLLGGGLA